MKGYAQDWTQYRKLRSQFFVVLVGYFPVAVALFLILPVRAIDLAFSIVNVCWLILLVFMALRLRNWRCPRCGERFFTRSDRPGLGFLAKICGNCQLPKYCDQRIPNESNG